MTKQNKKIIRNILVLLLLVLTLYIYISEKYIYITGDNLLNQSYIVYGGKTDLINQPIVNMNSTQSLIPFFEKKEVQISNLKDETTVYEVIEVRNLRPIEQYDVELQFKISGLKKSQNLIVGYQDQKINTIEDNVGNQTVNNVDLTNSKKFTKAEDDYISVPLTIVTNEEGNGYFYIGIDVTEDNIISYSLSDVRIAK